jgi:DNA-binding NarL/FixJ family response regulator
VTIRVVLAEDSYLVRMGLRRLLEAQPDLELVAECEDKDSLLAACEATNPDVVLTDIRMPPAHTDEGIQVAEQLGATSPSTGVVVLSQYDEADYALALLEKGSAGRAYLLKERVSDFSQVFHAIKEVAKGGSVIDPKVVESLVTARSKGSSSVLRNLTRREMEVLSEIAQGKTNAAIAESLFLTERSVEKHINSIFSKLTLPEDKDTHRRVKAVLMFLSEQR